MTSLPLSKDLDHHLSTEALRREPSPLKVAFKYFGQPGLVFLGGGLPLADYFPWNGISFESPKPPFENGIGYVPETADEKVTGTITKPLDLVEKGVDVPLARALQYGHTNGQPELLDFLKEHTRILHNMKYQDWDIIVNTGNTQSWDNVLRNFCDKGDIALVEEYSFSSSLEAARSQSVTCFPIPMDAFGIIPEKLESLLANWVGKKSKLIYTVPTGQNPTGSSLSNERREAIYKTAQKYDLIIVEDEPYFFLQMDPYTKNISERSKSHVADHDKFLSALVKSFLSLDVDGRVLRLDSFSKTLAPGTRIGWITARSSFVERLSRLQEVSCQNASGFSQAIVAGTLNRWGQEGYIDWLIKLRHEYSNKRDVTADAIYSNVPSEVTEFIAPVSGMFFTIRIDTAKHPKFKTEYNEDPLKVENAIFEAAIAGGTLMIPGTWFVCPGQTDPPQPGTEERTVDPVIFFRGTYAATPLDVLEKGIASFGETIRKEFELK